MNTKTITARGPHRPEPPAGYTVSDAFFLVQRFWYLIVLGILLGMLGAAGMYYLTPLAFRSETKLLVRYIADASAGDPGADGGRILMLDGRGEHAMNTEIEIMASQDTLATVVDRIGLDKFPANGTNGASLGSVVRNILHNLQIDVPRRGNFVRITYDGPDPELSVNVLKNLVEVYQEKHLRVRRSVAGHEFLVQQTDLNRSRLSETEMELRKLKNEFGVVSLEESRQNLTIRMENIRNALGAAEADLAAAEARFKMMEPGMKHESDTGHFPGSVSERLYLLEKKEQEILLIYRASSTPVQHIRAQIEALRQQYSTALDGEDIGMTDEQGRTLFPEAAEVAVQRARIGALRSQLNNAQAESKKLESSESRIAQLERNRQIQEANYLSFSRSLEQAKISEAVDLAKLSSISVIQPATLVSANHRPNVLRNMLLAIAGGFSLSLVTIAGKEIIPGRRVRRVKDMEGNLGIPVLLSVPPVRHKSPPRKRKKSAGKTRVELDAVHLPTVTDLQSYYDALGDIVMRTMNTDASEPCVIGVTGICSGVGVTTMAAGLALSLAQQHESRVLLMDPEPQTKKGGRLPGIPSSSGALDILGNAQGNVRAIEHNLFVLGPALEAPASSTALVRKWPNLVDQARQGGYRFVVLDLPTLTSISPSIRLLNQIHGTILVVEADSSTWAEVQQTRNLVERHGGRVLGAVLNKHSGSQ